MFGVVAFTYGLLTSFILSGASRNKRLRRPNPPIMDYAAFALCAVSAASAVLLLIRAGAMALGLSQV